MTNEARENIGQNKHEYRYRPLYSLLHSPGVVYQSACFIYACCHKLVSPAILMASDCLFVPNEFDAHSLYTKKTLIFSRINEKCMIQCVYVNTNDDWMRFFLFLWKKEKKLCVVALSNRCSHLLWYHEHNYKYWISIEWKCAFFSILYHVVCAVSKQDHCHLILMNGYCIIQST